MMLAIRSLIVVGLCTLTVSWLPVKGAEPFGKVRIVVDGCSSTGASIVHVSQMENGTDIAKSLSNRDGVYYAELALAEGYYRANVKGSCSTPASNEPFIVLSGRQRVIHIHTGSGIGLLLSGGVGLAGNLDAKAAAVYLLADSESNKAVLADGAYYFDYMGIGEYTMKVVDQRNCELYMVRLHLSRGPALLFQTLNLTNLPSSTRCNVVPK